MVEILTGTSPYAPNLPLKTTAGWHLARRASSAASADIAAEIDKIGYYQWLDQQINWQDIDDTEYEEDRQRVFPAYGLTMEEIKAVAGPATMPFRFAGHFQSAIIHEQWRSKRHLRTAMLSFMFDSISLQWGKAEFGYIDHISILRKGVLGKYSDLLKNVYKCYGIHQYLNNDINTKDGFNENLGRELLELHTIGTVYSQDDVMNAAKMLTGFTGEINLNQHYIGPLSIYGLNIKNDYSTSAEYIKQIDDVIDYLTHRPETALRIAKRLITTFVSDTPNPQFAQKLADVYLKNDTNMSVVIKELFMSDEFKKSVGQKIKRPQQIQSSLLRSGHVKIRSHIQARLKFSEYYSYDSIYSSYLLPAGHIPLEWIYPDGYPLSSSQWMSTSIFLANFSLDKLCFNNDEYLTMADFLSDSGIVIGKDIWNDAVPKMYEHMTGWKVTDSVFKNTAAGLALNSDSTRPPNLYLRPTALPASRLSVPIIRSPYMLIS